MHEASADRAVVEPQKCVIVGCRRRIRAAGSRPYYLRNQARELQRSATRLICVAAQNEAGLKILSFKES